MHDCTRKNCISESAMAACENLKHIFDKPIPDSPILLETLSPWSRMKHTKPGFDDPSCTELFGELHFKENINAPETPSTSPSSPLSSSFLAITQQFGLEKPDKDESEVSIGYNQEKNKSPSSGYCHPNSQRKHYRHSDSFSSMNSDNLSMCTEGLGSESCCDDIEDLSISDMVIEFQQEERTSFRKSSSASTESYWSDNSCLETSKTTRSYCSDSCQRSRSRTHRGSFPPPISSIGRSGKPWVSFKSHREDGRFILEEIRFPNQEFLHACRENGRLKLQFVQSDEETFDDDDEEEEDEEEQTTLQKGKSL